MYRQFGKRLLDIVIAAFAVLLLSPLMVLVGVAIRIEDGGPSIFAQQRVGRGRSLFTLYKFRSMPTNTANVPSTHVQSLRTTKVGAIIRRLNVDELPQLFNVIRGEMSLVGPRPALPVQDALLAERSKNGSADIKPGLTGLAQVGSYDGMPESEKAALDGCYAKDVTFLGDLIVISRTFAYLLRKPPVY